MADTVTISQYPKSIFHRDSVTRGTISSMAKEVVKPDNIKQQQRRWKRVKNPDHIQSPIRASIRDSQQSETSQEKKKKNVDNNKKKRSGAKMTAPLSVPPSTETRLDTSTLGTMDLSQHSMIPTLSEGDMLRCGIKNPWEPIQQRNWMSPSPEEEEEEEDSGGSSSASSFSANFANSNDISAVVPFMSNYQSEQDIFEHLDTSFKTYSIQVRDILENPGIPDQSFIEECRSLIQEQNLLLNQLEALSDKKKSIQTPSKDEDIKPVTCREKPWTNFAQLFQTSGVTSVTIHEKVNEPNSIVAVVRGTGTTRDPTLLPQHMKKSNNNNSTDRAFDTSYELNITLKAKETVFVFTDEWKPDSSAKQCEFTKKNGTRCDTIFSFFNRRHHCRKCGHIYCGSHSHNKLPLFMNDKPITSRVCDHCFSTLLVEHQ